MNSAPNELAPLLIALGRAGIDLAPHTADFARLRFKCPDGRADLSPDLLARLRLHRAAILGLLAGGLGMPTHPGSFCVAGGGRGIDGTSCTKRTTGV
jgi:hypothetical protein